MKTILLSTLLFLCLSVLVSAQEAYLVPDLASLEANMGYGSQFTTGLQLGYNVATIGVRTQPFDNWRTQFKLGADLGRIGYLFGPGAILRPIAEGYWVPASGLGARAGLVIHPYALTRVDLGLFQTANLSACYQWDPTLGRSWNVGITFGLHYSAAASNRMINDQFVFYNWVTWFLILFGG